MARLTILLGDLLSDPEADTIVNAANQQLAGGGGIDAKIHRAAGPTVMEECRAIGGCPTGSAVATGAGKLPFDRIVHAVAPRWRDGSKGEDAQLEAAYRRSVEVAAGLGTRVLAFPSLGTGAYRFPLDRAAPIALRSTLAAAEGTGVREIRFWLFDERTHLAFSDAALQAGDFG